MLRKFNLSLTTTFPQIKPKNAKGELLFKMFGCYLTSSHPLGKLIHEIAKAYIKMSVGIFTEELQKFSSSLQGYIKGYFTYKQIFKLNHIKVQEIFKLCGSKQMDKFTKNHS